MKKTVFITLTIICLWLNSFTSFATIITNKENNWKLVEDEWYYIGKEQTPGLIEENGHWYYIDEKNKLITGTIEINNEVYTFNEGQYKNIPYGAMIEDTVVQCLKKEIENIRYLEIKESNMDYKRIIFILPDITEDNSYYKEYGYYLADKQSLILILNLYTRGSDYEVATIPDIITKTADNITQILNIYKPSKDIEINIIGMSIGGMVGSYYVYKDDYDINKLAMILSTPDFTSLNHPDFYYTYSNGAKVSEQNEEEIIKDLQSITPLNNVLKLFDTEIYMINAKDDKHIPYEDASQFYYDMRDEMNINFLSLDSNQHIIKEDVFKVILDFIV